MVIRILDLSAGMQMVDNRSDAKWSYIQIKKQDAPNEELKSRVANLSTEIKHHFHMSKRSRVRKGIIPGNSKSIWKAMNIAKDINSSEIPTKMYKENVEIHRNDIPECFAEHFSRKISDLLANIEIDDQVFNGTRKLWKAEQNFMTSENIVKAVQSIKMKNAEGEDRIPQRILIDGISIILSPLTTLCNRLNELNNQVDLDWLNQSLISFKLKMKSLLLMN